jgi:hypothetical protein
VPNTEDTATPLSEESRKLTLASIETMLHRLNCTCDSIRLGHYAEPPIGHLAYMVDQLKDIEEVMRLTPNPFLVRPSGLTYRGKHFLPQ